MKLKFFEKKQKPEYFSALNIGTETIKTLVFKKEGQKRIILGQALEYFEEPTIFREFDSRGEIWQKTISKVIAEVQSITKIKTQNLLLGLPTNILIGRIAEQSFSRENSKELIEEREESQIHQEIFKQVKFKLSNEFAQKTGLLPQDFHFLNLKILESKIDGYEVPSILKMTGANFEFKVLATFLSKYQLEKIKEICQNLNPKILKIVHLADNFPHLFSQEKLDALFLDIGGQLTNVLILEKGKLAKIFEFEKAGIDFTKKISQVLGMSFSEARSLKHDFAQTVLSKGVMQKIKEIISPDIKDWFKNLKENVQEFPHKLLPSKIFLFGGGSLLPQISEILEKGDWNDLTFVSKPKIDFFYPKNFKNIESQEEILNNPQNTSTFFILYD